MKREPMGIWRSLVFAIAGLLYLAPPAGASTIELSSHTSDESVSASLLAATLDFQVNNGRLTLAVSNASSFDIGSIYFNASALVTGLALETKPNPKWSLSTDFARTSAAGFGTFDYALTMNAKFVPDSGLFAGDTAVFEFAISGTSSPDGSGFTTNPSTEATDTTAYAAAKFVAASDVFGALHAPEPSTVLLLGMGLVGIALRGRAGRHSSTASVMALSKRS